MQIAPPVQLAPQLRPAPAPWEFALRYVAATAATLVAIAGAQLRLENSFIWLAAALTIVGVPVSVWLRLNGLRIGRWHVSPPLWNALTVLATLLVASRFVLAPLLTLLLPLLNGQSPQFLLLRLRAEEVVGLLMQVFLLFAAFRSFALISDKDATLTTVPSFSVLLLLIPVQRQIEIVLYFVLWASVAATLFALDHRAQVRSLVCARVPAPTPGQDVRLAARALATVLGFSLAAAMGISYFLTLREASDRSEAEAAITSLASRLTAFALSVPEGSVSSGPERQIDFSNGPALPSRATLWRVRAQRLDGITLRPAYWRLFTLNTYNGSSWLPGEVSTIRVPRRAIARTFFRRPRDFARGDWGRRDDFGGAPFSDFSRRRDDEANSRESVPGYLVRQNAPGLASQFGTQRTLVRQSVTAVASNIGFAPVLPSVDVLRLPDSAQNEVRVRGDGALDPSVMQAGQTARLISDVPALAEYGNTSGAVPTKFAVRGRGVLLTGAQRQRALQLPARLPARVRAWGEARLRSSVPGENNYRRALRLAFALQNGATYTLRPPAVPAGRDATDFFLFDGGRRGYCTYFAGALTVLCRAQGIPARVVSGFVSPQWNENGEGILREANAHAWTEVWVDGWGWALVDATPPSDRGDNAPNWMENWGDWLSALFSNALIASHNEPWKFGLGIGAALALGALVWIYRRWARRRDTGAPSDDERRAVIEVYAQAARRGARAFRPRAAWETPDEWLQPLCATLPRSDAESLRRLTALYLAARYATAPLPQGSARLAREIASQIHWKHGR